jgi:hypothetical protein
VTTTADFQPDERESRNAMRAYLQRCEVRLSTMHRVVTAFVSGAALMVLIPVFFKDVVGTLIQILLNDFGNRFPTLDGLGLPLTITLYLCIGYVLGLSFVVPLRALYLLFKDITDFYITITTPGAKGADSLQNPAFALTGVSISEGEVSDAVRQQILRYQYRTQSIDFMLPFSDERRRLYFDPLLESTRYHDADHQRERARIIPAGRDMEELRAAGVLEQPGDAQYERDVLYFNVALGVARSYTRDLAEEVAKTEMSLVRHSIYLRRLVFRYVATLMMFIWTLLVLFSILSVLQANLIRNATPAVGLMLIAVGCLLWTLPVQYILHRPMNWIYRPVRSADDPSPDKEEYDPQLNSLEQALKPYHRLAIVSSVLGVALALFAITQGG